MAAKKKRLRKFYVQLVNFADRRDNEAIKVSAYSEDDARAVACLENLYDYTRFCLGYVVRVTGRNKHERQLAKELKAIC